MFKQLYMPTWDIILLNFFDRLLIALHQYYIKVCHKLDLYTRNYNFCSKELVKYHLLSKLSGDEYNIYCLLNLYKSQEF